MKKHFYLFMIAATTLISFLFLSCNNAGPDKTDPQTQPTAPEQTGPGRSQAQESPERSDPATDGIDFSELAPTINMSFEELAGDNGDYSDPDEYPEAGTFKLVVNEYYQYITAYKKDGGGEYKAPVRYMICSTGSDEHPTPTGTFEMGNERYRFSEFETYDVYGQYWSQVTDNIYLHSVLYSKEDANTYIESSYKNLGKRVSHGCIRLLVPDARWIYYNAAPGTTIEIIEGKEDSAAAAVKEKLTRAELPDKRIELKKGGIPVTEPWPGYTGPVS